MIVAKWLLRRAICDLLLNGSCWYEGRQYDPVQAAQLADFATSQSVHVSYGIKSRADDSLGLPLATDVGSMRRPRPALVHDAVLQTRVFVFNCVSLRVVERTAAPLPFLSLPGTSQDIDTELQSYVHRVVPFPRSSTPTRDGLMIYVDTDMFCSDPLSASIRGY